MNLSDLWDNNKSANICVFEDPDVKEKERIEPGEYTKK